MSYTALYRKFRPDNFSDVKGQDHIVTTLKNQIEAQRIGHAYLFCGTRGTGKTTIAKLFAKTVNCENPKDGNPCLACASCKAIAAGASMNVIEMDAASNNGVDNIRDIIEDVSFPPAQGRYKVYIIDEVHMLSIGAFNALLKTLEEPPSYCIFILATTEVQKIPVTILSRCQRYDFKRISIDTIADRLTELMQTEKVEVEPKALRYIAKTADGSMRDALSLLDQCIAFHFGHPLTYDMVLDVLGAVDTSVFSRLLRTILEHKVLGCISLLEEIIMQGRELTQVISDFIMYLRNLLIVKTTDEAQEVLDVSTDTRQRLQEEAKMTDAETIMRFIRVFSELSGNIRFASQKRIMTEVCLIKLCKPQMETSSDALLDRIRVIEEKLEKGEFGCGQVVTAAPLPEGGQNKTEQVRIALPDATPQELKKVIENWGQIKAKNNTLTEQCLRGSKCSISPAGELMLGSDNYIIHDALETDAVQKDIQELIETAIKKSVKLVVKQEAKQEDVASSKEFDDTAQDSILTDIEIEEE